MNLDSVREMNVLIDEHGTIVVINKRACEVLEIEEHDAVGKNWFTNFIPDYLMESIISDFSKIFNRSHSFVKNYNNVVMTKSGKKKMIYWSNTILYFDGAVSGVFCSGQLFDTRNNEDKKMLKRNYKDQSTNLYIY